jgi:hypothetical protein
MACEHRGRCGHANAGSKDLQPLPLGDRKAKLAPLLAVAPRHEHSDEDGAVVFRHACKLGSRAFVSKRLCRSGSVRPIGLDRRGLDQVQEPGQPGNALAF